MSLLRKFVYRLPLIRGILKRLTALEVRNTEQKASIGNLTAPDSELQTRISDLETRLRVVETSISTLRALVLWGRTIDLVKMGDLKIFMYTDDLGYRTVPEPMRHYRLSPEDLHSSAKHVEPDHPPMPVTGPMDLLIQHYWQHNIDFVFVDVGCQYGTSAFRVARFIQSYGRDNQVICFEPGIAGWLVAHNVALNGLQDQVTFEPMAIGHISLPQLIFGEVGHSENNRIVNRDLSNEAFSSVVPTVSIDDYIRQKKNLRAPDP